MNREQRESYRRLRLQVYGALPTIACRGLCTVYCGPIGMTALERTVIEEKSGHTTDVDEEARCTHLRDDRCSVYSERPVVCRLFGIAEGMECPHGCKPSRMLTRGQAGAFFAAAAELGGESTFGPVTAGLMEHIATHRDDFPSE